MIEHCPFCDSPDVLVTPTAVIQGNDLYQVFCRFCGATGPASHYKEVAIKKWNKVAELREQVKEMRYCNPCEECMYGYD